MQLIKARSYLTQAPNKFPLEELDLPTTQDYLDQMIRFMHECGGVGLAANQVGWNATVCVVGSTQPLILINPSIHRRIGSKEFEGEGCLSLPGQVYTTQRSKRIWMQAWDRHGKVIRMNRISGFMAHVIQHEVDHLNGILLTERSNTNEHGEG